MNRRILAVLVSIVLALVGTGAVFLYVTSADARAIAGKKARAVVVADKRIPAGTSGAALRSGDYLRQVTMPAETVPDDAIEQVTGDLDELVVTAEVQRGQLILKAMMGSRARTTGGRAIPDGTVGVTAKVKASTFGPGAVTVGARVAVFYTYTPLDDVHRNIVAGGGLEKTHVTNNVTRLLLNEVEVLAVGNQGAQQAGDGKGSGTKSNNASPDNIIVTFALSQVDAERLAHAVALGGDLNVALLGDDSKIQVDQGVDNRTLFR